MSNYVHTFAIPWAESVCKEFEALTDTLLLFDPPWPGDYPGSTNIRFYTRNFEFENTYSVSSEFILQGSFTANHLMEKVKRDWERSRLDNDHTSVSS